MIKRLTILLASLFILISGTLIYVFIDQERYILKQQTLPQNHQFYFDTKFEELNFPHPDGSITNALYFKVKRPKGVVLYLHGRGGNMATYWGYLHGDFTDRGYNVLMIDYRGFGKSLGTPSEQKCFEDAEVAYRYLTHTFSEKEITVYGVSFGTGIATNLASRHNPRLLILEAPYYSMIDLIPRNAPWLPPFLAELVIRYKIRTDLFIQNVRSPIHIFHGREDSLIPFHCSERLVQKIKTRYEFTPIEKGTHNFLSRHPEYQIKLAEILP